MQSEREKALEEALRGLVAAIEQAQRNFVWNAPVEKLLASVEIARSALALPAEPQAEVGGGGEVTFDAFCKRERAANAERDELAWHLAQMRARQLYKQLRPQPRYPMNEVKK